MVETLASIAYTWVERSEHMKPAMKDYLANLWNQHEARHVEMEMSGEPHDSEFAQFLVAAKTSVTALLLEAGYVNAGYIDPEKPFEAVWVYDPDEAKALIEIVNSPVPLP